MIGRGTSVTKGEENLGKGIYVTSFVKLVLSSAFFSRYGRDDRYKDRKDRDRRRSRSPRDRRRSRSPRRDRSRSRSRDRGTRGGYGKRYERAIKDRYERPGRTFQETFQLNNTFELLFVADPQKTEEKNENKDRFFMPGITGRFRDQIEKRKLLWQKKDQETPQPQQQMSSSQNAAPGGSRITKVWEATTFAQDTDGEFYFQ